MRTPIRPVYMWGLQPGYDLIEKARKFAIAAHGDQKYGNEPYEYHLFHVCSVLTEFGFTPELTPHLHAAACLHDVLEDTDVTLNELQKNFPKLVVKFVAYMTKKLTMGVSEYYGAMLNVRDVVPLKYADTIANCRVCRFDMTCVHDSKRVERGKNLLQKYRNIEMYKSPKYKSYAPQQMVAHLDWLLTEDN